MTQPSPPQFCHFVPAGLLSLVLYTVCSSAIFWRISVVLSLNLLNYLLHHSKLWSHSRTVSPQIRRSTPLKSFNDHRLLVKRLFLWSNLLVSVHVLILITNIYFSQSRLTSAHLSFTFPSIPRQHNQPTRAVPPRARKDYDNRCGDLSSSCL